MIFKQDDIAIFSEVSNDIKSIRFHKPTGVYFALVSGANNEKLVKVDTNNTFRVGDSEAVKVDKLPDYFQSTHTGKTYQLKLRVESNQIGEGENELLDNGYRDYWLLATDGRFTEYAYYVRYEEEATRSFSYFEVAQLNSKGETIDKKTFDGKTQKSFFEAVDYFEQLVEKREPQPEQEDPSVGIFIYFKGRDCFADVFGNKVRIDLKDVSKVFTPPVKKKYGRLNMYAVEDAKYDQIKGKFALDYDKELTERLAKEFTESSVFNPPLEANENMFVYKMTPYDTSESGNESEDPEDVNDEQLSPEDIEGEEPENMTGENAEQNGNEGDGDAENGDGDGQEGDADGDGEGDGQEGDGDGDGDGEGNGDESGESGDPSGKGGEGEFNNEAEQELQEGESQGGNAKGAEGEQGQEGEMEKGETYTGEGAGKGENYDEAEWSRVIADEIPASNLKSERRMNAWLDGYTKSELETMFNTKITSQKDFRKSLEELRSKLFENE